MFLNFINRLKNFMRIFFTILFILVLPLPASSFDLAEATKILLRTDEQIKAAQTELKIAQQEKKIAWADFMPSANLRGSTSNQDREFDRGLSFSDQPLDYGVDLRQNIYAGGKDFAQFRQANYKIKYAEANYNNIASNRAEQLMQNYFELLYAQSAYELNQDEFNIAKKQFDYITKLQQHGQAIVSDVKLAEANYNQALVKKLSSKQALAASESNLRYLLNDNYSNKWQFFWPVDKKLAKLEATDLLLKEAYKNNPELKMAQYNLNIADYQITSSRGGFLPSLDLMGSINSGDDRVDSVGNRISSKQEKIIMLQGNVPLFAGGKNIAAYKIAKYEVAKAGLNLEDKKQEIAAKIRRASLAYENAINIRISYQANVDALQIASDKINKEYKLGTRTILEILDVENRLLEAKIGNISAKRDLFITQYQLMALTGKLIKNLLKTKD